MIYCKRIVVVGMGVAFVSIFFKTLGWASAAFFWFLSAGMIMTGAWVSGVVIGVLTLLFVPNISAKIAGLGKDKLKEKQGFGGHVFRFNAHYQVWFLALAIVISAFLFLVGVLPSLSQ